MQTLRERYFLQIICLVIFMATSGTYFFVYYADNLTNHYSYRRAGNSSMRPDACSRGCQNYALSTSEQRSHVYTLPRPAVKLPGNFTCHKLIFGDQRLFQREMNLLNYSYVRNSWTAEDYINASESCSSFIKSRQYIMTSLTEEEQNFPIAFSILMYRDVEQVERLLRTIYRPQNFYCIHIDKSAPRVIHRAMSAIVSCFKNVFVPDIKVNVRWGRMSVLNAEMVCLKELWNYKSWKYFINLTGQEFPLQTNFELVRILKAFQGANLIEGTIKNSYGRRTTYVWRGKHKTRERKPSPPANITLTKGAVHIVAQRGYVDYILHNDTALDFFDWLQDTSIPDESFFSTMNYNRHLHVPGSSLMHPDRLFFNDQNIQRYKVWKVSKRKKVVKCRGKQLRGICILSLPYLPSLAQSRKLFANKFIYPYDPLALDCMEEWLFNKTWHFAQANVTFNDRFYRNLLYVKHKYVPPLLNN